MEQQGQGGAHFVFMLDTFGAFTSPARMGVIVTIQPGCMVTTLGQEREEDGAGR